MRLIIICDQPLAARGLYGGLSNFSAEILWVTNPVELEVACKSLFELALINVAWAELAEYIRVIRESPSGANCSILVASERLLSEPRLAGVLPKFRAMPCIHDDLVKLARWLITGGQKGERQRNLCPL